MILFFDTETTGLPKSWGVPRTAVDNWPRLVQLGWILCGDNGQIYSEGCEIIQPEGFRIPKAAVNIHGITTQQAKENGIPISEAMDEFRMDLDNAHTIVAHNIDFDESVMCAEYYRMRMDNELRGRRRRCTMREAMYHCRIHSRYGYKWPTLGELYFKLFRRRLKAAHDALVDCRACMECYFELKRQGVSI